MLELKQHRVPQKNKNIFVHFAALSKALSLNARLWMISTPAVICVHAPGLVINQAYVGLVKDPAWSIRSCEVLNDLTRPSSFDLLLNAPIASLKEELEILDRPRVFNIERANIQAKMAGIFLLLKRVF